MSRFRAFLSYSHADERFAVRFHKDLETWRADRALLKRQAGERSIPRDLRPIFRDRDDFAGGQILADATREALRQSDFMILLCSPAAARSRYVNEEVRQFKAIGGAERIIPVIIDGEPGDPERECFPPALVHRVDADGRITDQVEDRLAADARDSGDGPRRALAKVIAGILGIPFDEIVRRAERAQRRRLLTLSAVAAAMTLLAVTAAGLGWLAEVRRVEAERNYAAALSAADSLLTQIGGEIIRIDGVSLAQSRAIIARATSIYDDLQRSLPDSAALKQRLLAARLLFAVAYQDKGHYGAAIDQLDEAEGFQDALKAAGASDPMFEAMLAYAQVEKAKALVQLGRIMDARAVLEQALSFELDPSVDPGDLSGLDAFSPISAALILAELEISAGDLGAARGTLDTAQSRLSELERQADPSDSAVVLWIQMGASRARLATAEGDDETALGLLHEAESLAGALVADRESKVSATGALAAILAQIADIEARAGEEEAAHAHRVEAAALIAQANEIDGDQRHFAAGEASLRFDAAIRALEADRIAEGLSTLGPAIADLEREGAELFSNPELARTFHDAIVRIARALHRAGLDAEARVYAERNLAFRQQAADQEPLADALGLTAMVVDAAGDHRTALALRQREVDLREGLAAADPSQRSAFADALDGAALAHWRLSERGDALGLMRRRVAVLDTLLAERPDDIGLIRDLGWSMLNLGELSAMNGDSVAARHAFQRARDLAAAALAAAPDDPGRMIEAAWPEARLAHLGDDTAVRWRRVEALLTRADARQPLGDVDEELMIMARIRVGLGEIRDE